MHFLRSNTAQANCTLIVDSMAVCDNLTNADGNNCILDTGVLELFQAFAGEGSYFAQWGGDAFACATGSSQCGLWVSADNASTTAEVAIEANFAQDVEPQDASYTYNHLGQRKSKTVNGVTTHFVYSDVDGQLLGEYTGTGAPIREYVYLEGERVAMVQYDNSVTPATQRLVYLANNHIGQVVHAWDETGNPVYERVQTPFGETMGEYSTGGVSIPVRFPGQYYDAESGFNQNHYRDYDPVVGGYIQPDPIGITKDFYHNPEFQVVEMLGLGLRSNMDSSGLNHAYGYAEQLPILLIDRRGLNSENNNCRKGDFCPKCPNGNCNDNDNKNDDSGPPKDQKSKCGECVFDKSTGNYCCYVLDHATNTCPLRCPDKQKMMCEISENYFN